VYAPIVWALRNRRVRESALALIVVTALLPTAARAIVVKDNLYAVKTVSASEAWAVGNFGSVYHTTDGGKTWEARDSGTKVPLFGVDFAGDQGWIVGKSCVILHTADGGRTWQTQKSAIPPEKPLFSVKAIDARTAWVVGDWGAMAVTHDGGATWEDRSLGTVPIKVEQSPDRTTTTLSDDIILYDISFPDPQHGYIAGEFGTVLATTDGGNTWQKQDVGTDKTLFGVSFPTPEKGWAVGIDGLILRTRDGGKTWQVQRGATHEESIEELGFLETLKNPGLYDVEVAGQYGAVVGDTGKLLTTADGGETWTEQQLPEKQKLVWMRGVSLVPGTHGFVVGANGFAGAIDHDRVTVPNGGPKAAPSP